MATYTTKPVLCDMCGTEHERAQPYNPSSPLWGSSLSLSGGYAEFWDACPSDPIPHTLELNLCHDCTLPIFRKIMGSGKYAHLKMDFFERSHANERPADEHPCCEYAYNPSDYFSS